MRTSPYAVPLILQCILFLIPINIFVIGDWLAIGVQWELFRYLQSYLGNSFIFFTGDINFITSGAITGRSALATGFNVTASAFLLLVLCFLLYVYLKKSSAYFKAAAIITIIGGCLFLLSDMIQYGVLFHGPAGFTIPIGVPIILFFGGWMYRMKFPDNEQEGTGEKETSEKNETP
ncbi:MAG: hypothetical protein ABSG28_09700 [Methanoregula sp.]|jgi:hypothetical protein|uniref:hypothetical protein n=1 Tax=Methanoregula sp. TaxID=2052170 RepID=UPI003C1B1542